MPLPAVPEAMPRCRSQHPASLEASPAARAQGVRHTTPVPAVRNTTPHGLPGAPAAGPAAGFARPAGLAAAARKRKAEAGPGFR
jgi:hypothetical protein